MASFPVHLNHFYFSAKFTLSQNLFIFIPIHLGGGIALFSVFYRSLNLQQINTKYTQCRISFNYIFQILYT